MEQDHQTTLNLSLKEVLKITLFFFIATVEDILGRQNLFNIFFVNNSIISHQIENSEKPQMKASSIPHSKKFKSGFFKRYPIFNMMYTVFKYRPG